jgi:hypothetical protein
MLNEWHWSPGCVHGRCSAYRYLPGRVERRASLPASPRRCRSDSSWQRRCVGRRDRIYEMPDHLRINSRHPLDAADAVRQCAGEPGPASDDELPRTCPCSPPGRTSADTTSSWQDGDPEVDVLDQNCRRVPTVTQFLFPPYSQQHGSARQPTYTRQRTWANCIRTFSQFSYHFRSYQFRLRS